MSKKSKDLFGHRKLLNSLIESYTNNNLSNSIIISGNKGVGKSTFVYYLIYKIYLKIVDQSIQHHHFNLIYNNSHPNIKILEKEFDKKTKKIKNHITIDQVRNLELFVYQTTLDNFPKFIIIDSADDLNINAANSLLKMLEEPTEKTFFILISHQLSILLPTIRSRCIKFKLNKLSSENFNKIVKINNTNLKEENINFLYDLSDGSPGLALTLVDEDINNIFEELFTIFSEKKPLSSKIINLSSVVSNYTNEKYKIYITLIKFILINIIKINHGIKTSDLFISNLSHSLVNLSKNLDNSTSYNILEYLNNNEHDLFVYNLDKKIFNLNIFSLINNSK